MTAVELDDIFDTATALAFAWHANDHPTHGSFCCWKFERHLKRLLLETLVKAVAKETP